MDGNLIEAIWTAVHYSASRIDHHCVPKMTTAAKAMSAMIMRSCRLSSGDRQGGTGGRGMELPPVDVTSLPPFSNASRCAQCGCRYPIRVHFDRGCRRVRAGDHFHRLCPCGHEWIERRATSLTE